MWEFIGPGYVTSSLKVAIKMYLLLDNKIETSFFVFANLFIILSIGIKIYNKSCLCTCNNDAKPLSIQFEGAIALIDLPTKKGS